MEVPRQETEDGREEIYGGGRNKRRGQENPRMKSSEKPKLRTHKQPLGEITYSLAHQYVGFLYSVSLQSCVENWESARDSWEGKKSKQVPGREKGSRYRQGGGEAMENVAEWAGVHTSHTFNALGHHCPLPSSLGGLTLALSTQKALSNQKTKPQILRSLFGVFSFWETIKHKLWEKAKFREK